MNIKGSSVLFFVKRICRVEIVLWPRLPERRRVEFKAIDLRAFGTSISIAS